MKKWFALFLAIVMVLSMAACGGNSSAPAEPTAAPTAEPVVTEEPAEAPAEAPADATPSGVATAADLTEVEEVVEEGMVPVGPENIKDGTYPVEMKSSSSMFKADHCELKVEDGKMEVTLFMNSGSYLYMFDGTALEAAAAPEADRIALIEGTEFNTFTLPLEALDEGFPFAAFSKNKELWYDRTLLFKAASLPAEAYVDGFLTTAESLGLEDGEYTVEVALSGGTGKASVESPAQLTVTDGKCIARIVWSSSKYDYVRIGEELYLPVNTEGNATFLLPVMYFDYNNAIIADTTAMSQPHEIAYTLRFNSSTIQPAG